MALKNKKNCFIIFNKKNKVQWLSKKQHGFCGSNFGALASAMAHESNDCNGLIKFIFSMFADIFTTEEHAKDAHR